MTDPNNNGNNLYTDNVGNYCLLVPAAEDLPSPAPVVGTQPGTPEDGGGGATLNDLLLATGAAYEYQHYTTTSPGATKEAPPQQQPTKPRRICRFPGCQRVIKSQGHCQRHGAAVKRCKIDGCEKQMQGAFQGMCKRHWRESTNNEISSTLPEQPPPPTGASVYDTILPQSISYKPSSVVGLLKGGGGLHSPEPPEAFPEGAPVMALVVFLRNNAHKEFGWHRAEERRSRGCFPVVSTTARLEGWERQLVLVEILLLTGGTPFANFKDLAHAWGREKNFHTSVATSVFERRGDFERKRRSDAGKPKGKRKKTNDEDEKAAEEAVDYIFPLDEDEVVV